MSNWLPGFVLVVGAYSLLKRPAARIDGFSSEPVSSQEVFARQCKIANKGDCLNKTGELFVADYPDQRKALALLQRMQGIQKVLVQHFQMIADNIDKQEPRYRMQWALQHGMKVKDEKDLTWQITRIRVFLNKVKHITIGEVIRQSHTDFTSYTLDKKDMSMCLRDRQNDQLYDDNLITYVFLHELAHIMSPTYGHDDVFVRCFQVMLAAAVALHLYIQVDYSKQPVNYCGGVYLNTTVWA